jgi:hypothetical protein
MLQYFVDFQQWSTTRTEHDAKAEARSICQHCKAVRPYRAVLSQKVYYAQVQDITKMSVVAATVSSKVYASTGLGLDLMRPKRGFFVSSATRGVTRPPSRGLFLRRDGRVEVGLTPGLILDRALALVLCSFITRA